MTLNMDNKEARQANNCHHDRNLIIHFSEERETKAHMDGMTCE